MTFRYGYVSLYMILYETLLSAIITLFLDKRDSFYSKQLP